MRKTIAFMFVAAMTAGCSSQLEPVSDDSGSGGDDFIPGDVQLAFDEMCLGAGCHDAASAAGGLSLEEGDSVAILTATNSTGDFPLVEIGNVNGSWLGIKMLPDERLPEGVTRVGLRMPIGRRPDHPSNALILGWIAGAELGPDAFEP